MVAASYNIELHQSKAATIFQIAHNQSLSFIIMVLMALNISMFRLRYI